MGIVIVTLSVSAAWIIGLAALLGLMDPWPLFSRNIREWMLAAAPVPPVRPMSPIVSPALLMMSGIVLIAASLPLVTMEWGCLSRIILIIIGGAFVATALTRIHRYFTVG